MQWVEHGARWAAIFRAAAATTVTTNPSGFNSVAALLADLGVEPGAPIAFGVVSPDRAEAEKLARSRDEGQRLRRCRLRP